MTSFTTSSVNVSSLPNECDFSLINSRVCEEKYAENLLSGLKKIRSPISCMPASNVLFAD